MKKTWKGLLAMALVVCNLLGLGVVGMPVAAATDDVTIYGMTVNDLQNPLGIDTAVPTFGWKLQSETRGQKQTAYTLTVAADDALNDVVWNSGKVESNDTTDIPYGGEALADGTRYYWQVTVYDMNGNAFVSDVAWFETAFVNGALTDGASWIEVGQSPVGTTAASYATNYTVELDVVSLGAVGLMFGGKTKTTGSAVMWQVSDKGSYFQLTPHKWLATVSGTAVKFGQDNYAELKANGFKMKVEVNNDAIKTYINGELISTVTTAALGYVPTLGFVGLRQGTGEACVIDNLVLTDYSKRAWGDVLAQYDFSTMPTTYVHNDSNGSNNLASITNGQFKISSSSAMHGVCTFVENLTSSDLLYKVDVDVVDVTDTIGILMSPQATSLANMLVWQIADKGTYYQIKPHYYSGGWKAFGAVDFAKGSGEYAALADGFHVTLEVTDNRIKAYVNGKLISDQHKSAFNNIAPTLKYVVPATLGSDLGGTLDNLKITDYSYVKEGQVLRLYDFEDAGLYAAGGVYQLQGGSTVANGVYTSNKISGNFEWFNKVVLERKAVVSMKPVNVHYTFEADVTCASTAASLLFNMTDEKNALMWQIVRSSTAVKIRPHKIVNNKFTAYTDIDITDVVAPADLDKPVSFKLEIADNSINTYVNGKLVSAFETSQLGVDIFLGKFGTRIATGEVFTLDNIKVVNYIDNAAGDVVFNYDCDTFNPFFRGVLKDGAVYFDTSDSKTAGIRMLHAGTDTFRKEFTAAKEIASARLYVTSYGLFNAYVNGERVGDEEMTPGWTEEDDRCTYSTFDVTAQLNKGANTLSVGINHGWESVSSERSNDPSKPFKLLAKMVITYTDGTTETVVTDHTWKTAHVGPVMLGELYHGEYYDATADVSFRENGFDDSNWVAAKAVTFNTAVVARDGGAIYVREDLERTPASITVYNGVVDASETQYGKINVVGTYGDETFTVKKGETAVIDFGQNFAGWENITVSGAKGTVVRIRHAEMLNDNMGLISRGNDGPEGSVYTANLRTAPATTHYVMSGEGNENYRPTTTYYGFRYIEITATADITVSKVRGEVATSVTIDTGSFETSDALLNRLYLNTVWGQYSNYFGQATDCPQRDERLGYSGDAQVFAGTAVYNAQVKAFLRNFMDTLVEGQASDGAYGNTLPAQSGNGSVWAGVAGWADAGIIVPYTYYKQYGDAAILSDYYDSMAKYMDYLNSMDLRIGLQFGDWLSYATNDTKMKEYLSYVYTIWDAQMMQEIAALLGKTEDIAKWKTMEEKYLSIARPLYLDENGNLNMTQQTALLFALKVGLYENDVAYENGKAALVNAIKSNGNKLNTGFLGTSVIMETLVEIGKVDLAYELLFQDADPSWLYSVKQGATTTWERWNSYTIEKGFGSVSMNSFNHYAYGCVGEFMYNTVLGINPDGAGYQNILLTPETTDKMTYAKGSYDSVNGLIESAWALDDNGLYNYEFTIPMNTEATIRLKKQPYSNYLADGATFLKEENGYVYYAVTSGKHTFTAEAMPALSAEMPANSDTFAFSVAGLSEYNGGYTANGNKGWYMFPATDTAVVNAINEKFHMYYDREGTYMQRTDATATTLDDADVYGGSTTGNSRWTLLYNNYLQRQTSKKYGEKMRKIDSLVPLDVYGREVALLNFETTFDVRFESETAGAVVLGFRQQTPGKFTEKWYKLNNDQAFVAIGRDGINIAGGNDIVSGNTTAGDMYDHWQTDTFAELLPQVVTVKVRAVGTTCEVWIYKLNTTEQLKHYAVEIPYEKAGTLAYGVSTVGHDIGDFNLIALDANGEKTDLLPTDANGVLSYRNGDITVTNTEKTDNGYKYTLQVAAKDGYELKAGSLIVTDDNGYAYVPTRVGFRNGGDASQYVVETTGGGVVSATFYQPTLDALNMGLIGTSVNTEKGGLRFVHRLNVTEEDGRLYMNYNGGKQEIAEYGILLASGSLVKDPAKLTLEQALASMHIKEYAFTNRETNDNPYYDYCEEYVDIAVLVVGITAIAGGADTPIHTRLYVKLADGSIVYSTVSTGTYNQTAGLV